MTTMASPIQDALLAFPPPPRSAQSRSAVSVSEAMTKLPRQCADALYLDGALLL
jgi:hypothetical protein